MSAADAAILRLLLTDLAAHPRRDDWQVVLDEVEGTFHTWQTWT